jgi:type VI secretion system protein ImpC
MDERSGGTGGRKIEAGFGATGEALPRMPLRIVVISELSARDLKTGKSQESRRRIRIDRQSFDEVMAGFGLCLFLDVPDRLSGGDKPLIVEIPIESLKSFKPDAVAARIPATKDLLALRESLADLRSAKVKVSDVRSLLASLQTRSAVLDGVRRALDSSPGAAAEPRAASAAAPGAQAPASDGGGGLDSLLSMVDEPASDSAAARGADLQRLDALVRHIVSSERTAERVDGRAVEASIKEIDAALSAQIDEVLHHPEFRRVESAWRSLRFLTDRIDFQQPIQLEILSSGRDTMIELYDEIVHVPEAQGISHEPLGLLLVDQLFDRGPGDIELMRQLSERGASLSVPIIVSGGASFLGLQRTGDLGKKSGAAELFSGPDNAKWQGLRQSGPSRWLGVVANRFLLRPSYAPGENAARGFDYTERLPGGDDVRLWGNPGWAIAALAARSFARIGWCTDIMGQRSSGMIEDLPVRPHQHGSEAVAFPLETIVSDDVERDFTANGVMALSSALNSDRAYLRFAPTAHTPQHYQDPTDRARAKLQSTLPFQMFVGRLINYAMMVESVIVPGRAADQITAGYDRALRELISTAGAVPKDAVVVGVEPNADDPSRQDLNLRVRWPGFQSLPGAGEIELRWPIAQ